MRKILLFILVVLIVLPSVLAAEKLYVKNVYLLDADEQYAVVEIELLNRLGEDARDIRVEAFIGSEHYFYNFLDLDRGEKKARLYYIPLPTDGEEDVLRISILHEELSYTRFFVLDLSSEKEIASVVVSPAVEKGEGESRSFWDFIFGT